MKLYTRDGNEFTGAVNHNGKHPTHTVSVACDRCHVFNGQRLWVMGINNNQPYSLTGFDCWTCGNTGVAKTREERLYTAEQLAKVVAAAEKRAEAKRRIAERAVAEQAAREEAFRLEHAEFITKLDSLGGDYWTSFRDSFLSRGMAPSERQVEVVDKALAKRAQNAASAFVGAIGDKVTLTLTVERVLELGERYSRWYIRICRDQNGNVVVYKGASDALPWDAGDSSTVTAKVTEHTLYKGVAQTVIQRPKEIKTKTAA